jgi:hypothetical protein
MLYPGKKRIFILVCRFVGTSFSSSSFVWAGGYPPKVVQPNEAYCTNLALGPPFISRGTPHKTTWEASISERRNYGRELSDQILPTIATSTVIIGFFYMSQICDLGATALLPLQRKACWELFRPKSPTASAGFEPANLGTRGQQCSLVLRILERIRMNPLQFDLTRILCC